MTWATPLLAAGAAAIAIPALLLLYFLKLKRRDLEVSTTLLWKKAIQDLQANAPFQKLRKNILLFLQLLALAAVLLAIAQPELQTGASAGAQSVIVIDRSASMSTRDVESAEGVLISRLDRAKEEAIEFVENLREPGLLSPNARDEAMVIAFDTTGVVTQAFTSDKARLRAAIKSIEPSDAPSRLDEAMRLAGAYAMPTFEENRGLVNTQTAPIHLWSDGKLPDAGSVAINPETSLLYRAVGAPDTANTAITAFRAERAFAEPEQASIFVGVQSTSAEQRDVDVELAINGLVTAIRTVRLPSIDLDANISATTSGVIFKLARPEGAVVRARLLATDALQADDSAWLLLPPARQLRVLYVAPRPGLLLDGLRAQDLSEIRSVTPTQYQQMSRAGDDAGYDVIVLDRWAPDETLPPGRYFIAGAAPNLPGVELSGTAPDEDESVNIIIDWMRDHPAMRSVSLENLFIAKQLTLKLNETVSVLAETQAGPVIAETTGAGVRTMMLAFDVADSNWLFDHNYVLFVGMALRHLAGTGGSLESSTAQPGAAVTTRLPSDASDIELTEPDGSTLALTAAPDGRVTFGPLRTGGLYRLRWSGSPGANDVVVNGKPQRVIAANLLDAAESQVGAIETLELASRTVETASADETRGLSTRTLWPWLIMIAIGFVMLEWFIYNRKVQI